MELTGSLTPASRVIQCGKDKDAKVKKYEFVKQYIPTCKCGEVPGMKTWLNNGVVVGLAAIFRENGTMKEHKGIILENRFCPRCGAPRIIVNDDGSREIPDHNPPFTITLPYKIGQKVYWAERGEKDTVQRGTIWQYGIGEKTIWASVRVSKKQIVIVDIGRLRPTEEAAEQALQHALRFSKKEEKNDEGTEL
jgi:hypothetical protein